MADQNLVEVILRAVADVFKQTGFEGARAGLAAHVKPLAAPLLVAHIDAPNACGLVYCGGSSIFGRGGEAAFEGFPQLNLPRPQGVHLCVQFA